MKWTEEQQEAISKEGSNIIVSAGAGSGKTAVLSERVLRKVSEGVDIRNILILTFTNEAAGEMKNRIRKKLEEAGLKEQLEYIDAAYITTFDAYALGIVKKYHYLLNISRNVSIIDSSIINLEKDRVLEEIFLELYETKDADFLKLVGDFTNRDDKTIKDAIISISRSLDLKYDKEEYLTSYLETFFSEQHIDALFLEYFTYLKNLAKGIENDIYVLEGLVDEKLYLKLYEAYNPFFSIKSYNDLYKIKSIPTIQFRGVSEDAIPYKESLKSKKDELLALNKYSEEELKDQIRSTKGYVKVIIKIILELDKRINAYKTINEAFEFTDIAKMAIRVVSENEEVLKELKNSYNEILIDEYQDTNDLQEMFISKIENNNVYMVGDIKQSIYRFRNANPSIFKNKYDNYAKSIGGKKIDLLKNFRSRSEVLDNINTIFNLIMTEECGSVNYQNNHAMVYGNLAYINEGANNNDNNMEIIKYDYQDKEYSNVEIEAFTIAENIKDKINSKYQVFDFSLKKNRDISYNDFCIILDRGTDMPKYKKIFEYLNIPMDVYLDSDLVDSNDIKIIKNIIKLILLIKDKEYNTEMRYAFVSIARSFIGGLTDAEIFNYIHENTFYDSVIYQSCFKLSKGIDNKTPSIILREIIDEFNFYENLIKVANIDSAIFRIDYILDLSSNMEALGFTIKDFLAYLEDMIDSGGSIRYKEARGIGNCVKIMNIHKSKGLEFPICYFAGFKKTFNLKELNERFMYDNKYGIITPFYKEGIGTTFIKTLIKNKYYEEEISEKIRLFYVALTRAKEKMIMVMPTFKKEMKATNRVDIEVSNNYRSFYDFINSISLNLASYITNLDLNKLGLTKDYEVLNNNINYNSNSDEVMEFRENNVDKTLIENKHASKIIKDVISLNEAKTLEFGTLMHERLEMTDFNDLSITNKYVDNLRNTFDFKNATIYKELEFIFESDNIEYHGIIDLMLEYDNEIKIIDYKLKNIDDEGYIKQLSVYYDYISSISDKKVKLYLYSIMDNKIKEIEYISM